MPTTFMWLWMRRGDWMNQSNLQNFIREGADLATFSGGKFIRGPQASGFVAGRKHLISAIAWQHLDMDVTPEVWQIPRELLDVEAMPFIPRQGIGRGYKAGKEEIMGLVTALRLFQQRDHAAERETCARRLKILVEQVDDTLSSRASLLKQEPSIAACPARASNSMRRGWAWMPTPLCAP